MSNETLSAKDLAKKYVGDGKSKLWFVTIAYGWYIPEGEDADYKQVPDSLESVTILVGGRFEANALYNSVMTDRVVNLVNGRTISQVMIENKTGVAKDKIYKKDGRLFHLYEF